MDNDNLLKKKKMRIKKSQIVISGKISAYLKFYGRDKDFIKQFKDGYCSGISTVWLYAKWLQTQPKSNKDKNKLRDDLDWFNKMVSGILD